MSAQSEKYLSVAIPSCQADLNLIAISGHESISSLFYFSLRLFPADGTTIDTNNLIGQKISFCIGANTENSHYFNGIISNFVADYSIRHGAQEYLITVVPSLWFLTKSTDCKIFQNKTTVEILTDILSKNSITFDISAIKGPGKQKKREYCVQYNESTFNFISRIMEEDGIFYYFEQSKDEHKLIMSDNSAVCKKCDEQHIIFSTGAKAQQHVSTWQRQYSFLTNKMAKSDYNFKTPATKLLVEAKSQQLQYNPSCEYFSYPGVYQEIADGKNKAKFNIETLESDYCLVTGTSDYSGFCVAKTFTMENHEYQSEEDDYLLVAIDHSAHDYSQVVGKQKAADSQGYANSFTCIPASTSFRPAANSAKPRILGAQTAIVVGDSNSEIYLDEYGRIKVQFPWDRYGKNNEASSCWIRVSQIWAGKNWGGSFHPRVGDEVVITFLDGDPDRPLVTGSVYNNINKPPFALPANKTQSGIISHSTQGGGATDSNEIRFEDKKGSEELYIHAQKDFSRTVENSDSLVIKKGNKTVELQQGSYTLQAKESIKLTVGSNTLVIDSSGITINGSAVNINN